MTANITQTSNKSSTNKVEELPLDGFDHIEFFVGNALQAAYFYQRGFGFDLIAYRGLETGSRDRVSYVLKRNSVCIVLTGSLTPDTEVAEHIKQHGDGVKTIALKTRDARKTYETAIARGATAIGKLVEHQDDQGVFKTGSIKTYGDTIHTFIERADYRGAFAPGFRDATRFSGSKGRVANRRGEAPPRPRNGSDRHKSSGALDVLPPDLAAIDHVVGNVQVAKMDEWVHFYEKVFGFYVYQQFDASDISTQYSSLVSKVMANKSGNIKLPINEPAKGLRKSQIQEYLDYYIAPGVQHIAIATKDIITTVADLKQRGIRFLKVPQTYYDALPDRVGHIDEDLKELAKLGILVDRESEGYLLQIFTKPVQDRPTLFFEIIQRKGAKGFGKGNFKALFESIEREQANRGNL